MGEKGEEAGVCGGGVGEGGGGSGSSSGSCQEALSKVRRKRRGKIQAELAGWVAKRKMGMTGNEKEKRNRRGQECKQELRT